MHLQFLKMSGVGNDFIIIDARLNEIKLSATQIRRLCDRKNIGCDQFVVIKNSAHADCLMDIFNSDGSKSAACGNATRCVASLIMEEKKSDKIKIETAAGVLDCWRHDEFNISVAMAIPHFEKNDFHFDDIRFFCVNVGNPHAVSFVDDIPTDEIFFDVGPKIESHPFFPQKTNVEFAKICSDDLIEVRVYERGAGETLACGSGACAVAALAIKNKLIAKNKTLVRFKGGDLTIEWDGEGEKVIMTGGYEKIFSGVVDPAFL